MRNKIDIYYLKEYFSFRKSEHLVHPRKSSSFSRDYSISDETYTSILKLAISNGLRSFRGSQVVITCSTHKGYMSLLIDVPQHSNNFTIVTAFTAYHTFWKLFIKVPNRINLLQFIIPKLSEQQKRTKDLALVKHTINTEGSRISAKELLSYYNL